MLKNNKEKTPKGRFKAGDRILPVDFGHTDGSVTQWLCSPKDEYLTVIDVSAMSLRVDMIYSESELTAK